MDIFIPATHAQEASYFDVTPFRITGEEVCISFEWKDDEAVYQPCISFSREDVIYIVGEMTKWLNGVEEENV